MTQHEQQQQQTETREAPRPGTVGAAVEAVRKQRRREEPGTAATLTEDQARIIDEYTSTLNRKLRENVARLQPVEVFGADGHVIRWLAQEITRDDLSGIKTAGRRIRRDMAYYGLSL